MDQQSNKLKLSANQADPNRGGQSESLTTCRVSPGAGTAWNTAGITQGAAIAGCASCWKKHAHAKLCPPEGEQIVAKAAMRLYQDKGGKVREVLCKTVRLLCRPAAGTARAYPDRTRGRKLLCACLSASERGNGKRGFQGRVKGVGQESWGK